MLHVALLRWRDSPSSSFLQASLIDICKTVVQSSRFSPTTSRLHLAIKREVKYPNSHPYHFISVLPFFFE
nr:hypothetical protein CFP56_42043 [Quercus suber]